MFAVSSDKTEILSLQVVYAPRVGTGAVPRLVEKTTGPVHLLAANDQVVAWAVEGAPGLTVRAVKGGSKRRVFSAPEDIAALALSPQGREPYYADQGHLYAGTKALPIKVKTGPVLLATDAGFLYWTESAEDGDEVSLCRCSLDALQDDKVEKVRIAGSVSALAAEQGSVYAVQSKGDKFQLLRYAFKP